MDKRVLLSSSSSAPASALKLAYFKSSPCVNFGIASSIKNVKACLQYPLASKIMVRNLAYSTTESSLREEFSKFGQIAEVKLMKDKETERSKGFAFIQYASQEEALSALDSMDWKYFDGRVIHVELAKLQKSDFGRSPKASGPPKNYLPPIQDQDDLDEDQS